MKWQRHARIAIVVFVLGFAALVALTLRRPQADPPAEQKVVQLTDKEAISQTTGGLVNHKFSDGKFVYTLKAETELVYQDGRILYTKAILDLPDRGGRRVTIHADEVEVRVKDGEEVGSARLEGNVRLVTDDGLELLAGEATFTSADGLLQVPGPVSFTRGRMSGTGIGATYDQNRDVVWLQDQARIVVAPDETGEGGLEATAGAAGLARGDHYAVLTRGGRIQSSGRDLQADDITIRMTADNERVERLELRANSRITGATGDADAMSARDIDLHYAEDGRTLRQAMLVDDAVVQLPGTAGGPGRRVAGRTIDIRLAPDGETVTSLQAAEAVQVDLPEPQAPARRITADALEASGPPDAGLQAATFTGRVEYRETGPAPGTAANVDRTARSDRLVIRTAPGLGAIQEAEFFGNAEVRDVPDLSARAPRIVYRVSADSMALSPGDGLPGPEPEATDGRATVKARTIELALATRGMTAATEVRTTLRPASREAAPDGGSRNLPAVLSGDKPVFVTSNRLAYDGEKRQATYAGAATLWQDTDTRIQAETIILDEAAGNLLANTGVRTLMQLRDIDPKTKAERTTATRGWAETFVYDDAKRMATYTTKARITGAQGDLTADRIELFLAADDNELERAEAHGAVTVKEGVRTALGTRLTYTAADDTYVMRGAVGAPVVVIENAPSGCQKSIGEVLTFRRGSVEHVRMEGSQGASTCTPEERRGAGLAPGGARR